VAFGEKLMKRRVLLSLVAAVALSAAASPGLCADLGCAVRNEFGTPVGGVTINALDSAGRVVGTATTDASGNYRMVGLPDGTYILRLVGGPGIMGEAVAVSLSGNFNIVDWTVSPKNPAIATAKSGFTCHDAALALGAAGVGIGTTIIGLAVWGLVDGGGGHCCVASGSL
jgi:hypothetical protein